MESLGIIMQTALVKLNITLIRIVPVEDCWTKVSMEKKINRIAIVGNGLDLHHGIKSSYKDFYCSDYMPAYLRDIYDILTESYHEVHNWYDFEEEYRSLIENELSLMEKGYGGNSLGLSEENQKLFTPRVNLINYVFQGIKDCFLKYLKKEYKDSKNNSCFHSDSEVHKYLSDADIILNFNYTDSVKDIYGVDSKKIIHVHGNLNGDPILGHSNYCDYDKTTGETINYGFRMIAPGLRETAYKGDKTLQRIEHWNGFKHSSGEVSWEKTVNMRPISTMRNVSSTSPISCEMLDHIYNYPFDTLFDERNNSEYVNKLALSFGEAVTIIVIGHGLQSDEDLLSKIPVEVEEVTLFQRSQEDIDLINRGKRIFNVDCIHPVKYEWY